MSIDGQLEGKVDNSLEVEVLEREVHLDDSSGLDAGSQNILFRRLVLLRA